ncbi:MAG: PaaI family thioesterase [Blastocatellia bacterium]
MASIFRTTLSPAELQRIGHATLETQLGIEFIEQGDDYLLARMPVDARTKQPYGSLHGGASIALAETLGSLASMLVLGQDSGRVGVGIEINANHLKPAREGWVHGRVTPLSLGSRLHIWDIRITSENGDLVCVSRLTTMVVERK